MVRYPHTLTFRWHTAPAIDPATGRPTEGVLVERLVYCRYEMGGAGAIIPSEGGTQLSYSYVIYSYPMLSKIPAGATVEIEGLSFTVIRMQNGQLNSRTWV